MTKPGEYLPSIPELGAPCAADPDHRAGLRRRHPQVGWCIGHNRAMNGMEYHKGNELMVTGTDLMVLLGQFTDVDFGEDHLDAAKHEAFFIPAGAVVEVYGLVLHFTPAVHADQGFRTLIILPRTPIRSWASPLGQFRGGPHPGGQEQVADHARGPAPGLSRHLWKNYTVTPI